MQQVNSLLLQLDAWIIVLIVLLAVAFITIAVIWGVKAHRLRISAGREELIGRTAEVRRTLDPKGTVFIEGEQWTAVSESGRVESGEEVVITRIDSLRLYVVRKQ